MNLFSGSADTAATLGQRAEDAALRFLQSRGMHLIERNYRCKLGEIDLIMQQNQELVFVEVRYRSGIRFGDGAESVNFRKQQKIIRCAEYFLQHHRQYTLIPCRIDVVSVTMQQKSMGKKSVEQGQAIDWIPNAIQA
ncbi:MAG: YraN family protein [Gammaproteobacteria bacterium]|nr:YraN family protein [Gammaproteobacteria bacterium]